MTSMRKPLGKRQRSRCAGDCCFTEQHIQAYCSSPPHSVLLRAFSVLRLVAFAGSVAPSRSPDHHLGEKTAPSHNTFDGV